jgi:hypothetical protein
LVATGLGFSSLFPFPQIFFGTVLEFPEALFGAEEVGFPFVFGFPGGISRSDIHAADRVLCNILFHFILFSGIRG